MMKRDFTFAAFERLLEVLLDHNYRVQSFGDFIENPAPQGSRAVILRHDVDNRPQNALFMARMESRFGIRSSYYFRVISKSYNEVIIKEIAALGNEIGYHYEDLALAGGNMQKAFDTFQKNLANLREIYPVKTICMHGSPLSRWDNRQLWQTYDYRSCGIIGEPYYDLDFKRVLYLTETGRKWNGTGVSVRDWVKSGMQLQHGITSTFDLLDVIEKDKLPDLIMVNVHPGRWENDFLAWSRQLCLQNIKNIFKKFITWKNERIQDRFDY